MSKANTLSACALSCEMGTSRFLHAEWSWGLSRTTPARRRVRLTLTTQRMEATSPARPTAIREPPSPYFSSPLAMRRRWLRAAERRTREALAADRCRLGHRSVTGTGRPRRKQLGPPPATLSPQRQMAGCVGSVLGRIQGAEGEQAPGRRGEGLGSVAPSGGPLCVCIEVWGCQTLGLQLWAGGVIFPSLHPNPRGFWLLLHGLQPIWMYWFIHSL